MKKVLFGVFVLLSLAASVFTTFMCWLAEGLGVIGTGLGKVVVLLGMAAVVVAIVGMILGIRSLRRNKGKQALLFALMGAIFSGVIIGGFFLDEALMGRKLEQDTEDWMNELYGEGWNSPSAIEGIPEQYEELLNQFYVTVRDSWSAEDLMNLGAVCMPEYYGDAPLENIGFTFMDLNGDGIDEMVIGTADPVEGATVVFCVYENPENPFYAINSVEGNAYYMHVGETEGTYAAEIMGQDLAWVIKPVEEAGMFDFDVQEGAMDPAGRLTLEMTPFAQYK